MSNNKKNKKNESGSVAFTVIFVLIGVFCGAFMSRILGEVFDQFGMLAGLVIELVLLAIAYYLQTIIHEAGHLVFGLATGYSFGSFRVGSVMLVKENGKLKIKKHSVAGTGGQCLMVPPEIVDGKMPVMLYNLGGVLMNLIAAAISMVFVILTAKIPLLFAFFVMMVLAGIISALINGIPMKMAMVNNDASNARELYKNEEAMRSFRNQFAVVDALSKGTQLCDMPSDWFFMPSDAGMTNSITASAAVFLENRLVAEGKLDEALALINKIFATENALVGLHVNLLINDKIFIKLTSGELDEARALYTEAGYSAFAKQMKNNISVIRTEYAYKLLCERDGAGAAAVLERFEQSAKTHPYEVELVTERELIALAGKETENK